MKKKILITGSNGLLGQKLVHALIHHQDIEVIASSKGPNRIKEKKGYKYEECDITNQNQLLETLKRHNPDVVINTAAMTNVDACENDKELCVKLNVKAVEFLINSIEELGSKTHLIHLSTDFIFDGQNGPYQEDDQPNPISFYGQSKWDAEQILMKSSIKWSIIRTIIVYGLVDDMSRSNIVLWAKDALEKGQKINVVDDQFRSPTLAEDLAEGCILTALKGKTGIFHVSGKETMSILELVYQVADYYGYDKNLISPSKSNSLNQPAKRPPRTGFIISKAEKELGYKPHSFLEGLKIVDQQIKSLTS
jgi:dTDP-4-dehydrorhamnose reductase